MNKFSFYIGLSFSIGLILIGLFAHNEALGFEGIGIALGMLYGFNTWGFALHREQMKNKILELWLKK